MRKSFLLFSTFILCCLAGYAQTLTNSVSTVTSGATVTIKGSGETATAYYIAEQGDDVWNVATGQQQYYNNQKITFTAATYYNKTSKAATSLQYKLTNTASVPVTVTYQILILPFNGTNSLPQQTFLFTVTVNPAPVPPPSFGNVAEPGPFIKNDCGSAYYGQSVAHSIPANTYHATTQAAANQMALDAGQAYANANGICMLLTGNDAMSASHYSAICAPGTYSAAPVVYNIPANTYFGKTKTDANTLATADLTANAQNYANNYAPCTVVPKPVITNISTSGTTLTITYINTSPPISNGGVQSFAVDNATGQSYPSGTNGPNTTTEVISGLTPGRTYSVTVKIWSDPQHTSTDNISDPFLVTMPGTAPPLITYYNIIESATFIKQGCGNGYQGSSVIFTVPASTYSSLISVDDANSKAIAYINSGAGQTYANSNGTCTQLSGVPTFTAAYGGHDGIVNFIVTPNIPNPYTSTLYWTDTTTGQSGASSGRATGFSSNFTDGHTYQFHFVCNGAGTPSSGTSATQTFNMP